MTAQNSDSTFTSNNLGIGIGLDYGGIGAKLSILPDKHLALFVGIGYNTVDLGYSIGASARLSPTKKFCPYASLMYGYSGAINIEGASQYNKVFHSPIVGFGAEFHSKRKTKNFFNLEVLVPFDRKEMIDYSNDLTQHHSVAFKSTPWPFNISMAYHFGLK